MSDRTAPAARPRPLREMPPTVRRSIRVVLTDIDDTLTTEGRLTALAYSALERLRSAGRIVVPVTGRPAGWCDHIARMWPVDAVVGENGAFYMHHDDARRALVRRFAMAEAERTADVDRIVALMQARGLTAKVSSIHVNGWFGRYDKLAMTRTLLQELFSIDLDAERGRCVFAGDSPNDAPMFAYFPHAVGVANIGRFLDRIETPPAYVTRDEAGAGFAELADCLLGR